MAETNIIIDVVKQYTKSVTYLNEAQNLVQEKIDAYLKARTALIDEIHSLKHSQADNNQMLDELEQTLLTEERSADGSYLG